MDLQRLSYFLVIAESGSFKEAAGRLQLAPNVLSARFTAFERSLGVTLIERSAHRFQLTPAGCRLRQDALDILKSYEQILSSMQSLHSASFRNLRLQLCAQTMASDLGPFLGIYCRRHPTLFLDLYDEISCGIREGLRSGMVDVAFAMGREQDFSDISGRIALNYFPRMRVHLPADHPLAARQNLHFSDLDGETFILYPNMKETCTRRLQLSMLEQSGISFRVYKENCSPFFFDLLVPAGKGIRLWNWSDRTAPNSVLLTLQDSGYETYLYLLYDIQSQNPSTMHFISQFLKYRKEHK